MTQNVTDDQVRRLNAELGFPSASAERWLHDLRADERREREDEDTSLSTRFARSHDEAVQRGEYVLVHDVTEPSYEPRIKASASWAYPFCIKVSGL